MKTNQLGKLTRAAAAILILQTVLLPVGNTAYAAVTDISDIPLAAFSSVKPNVMYTLDNSGSMAWNSVTGFDGLGEYGNANRAFYSSSYNKIYYNPAITYTPPVNYLGVSMGNAPRGAARVDPFPTTGGSLATTRLTDTCNGTKDSVASAIPTPSNCANVLTRPVAMYAFYYVWDGVTNIAVANPANAAFPQRVDITQGRTYPRKADGTAGIKPATRTDCITPTAATATNCTYDEEIQNFANWYSYYSSRILMTKTSLGRVFAKLDDKFRVGFNAINTGSTNNQTAPTAGDAFWQNIEDFNTGNKQAWFNRLYNIRPQNSTPLRNQMQKIGRYFSGTFPGATDPVQYSCQSNYHILSTDGFWNDAVPGTPTVGSTDSDPTDTYSTVASGSFDRFGYSNTLSDVAMYYYKNDLRTSAKNNCTGVLGIDVCENNVKTNSKDGAKHQHMTVYTVGLGAGGQNPYFEDYEIRSDANFAGKGYDANFWLSKMKAGDTAAANNWPAVPGDTSTTIDDLWHAAINARGTYLNAGSPDRLIAGLGGILNDIAAREGAGSGAALSGNDIRATVSAGAFSVRYDSGNWSGDVLAYKFEIDPATGLPAQAALPNWRARDLLDALVTGDGWDKDRKIFTIGNGGTPKPFAWDKLSSDQQTALVNKDVLKYLRGDNSNATFRQRKHVLGDIVGSEPAYITAPKENYQEADNPGYETKFKVDYQARKPMLYVGANDGMLHAFNADLDIANGGGKEVWAYVPTFAYKGPTAATDDDLAALSNPSYVHRYFVDAKPQVRAVDFARAGVDPKSIAPATHDWHTMLVAGLGKGGKGYFALDITNPGNDATESEQNLATAKVLWEFTDADMGLTYGEPLIIKTRKWGWVVVVSSGYNNITGPNPGQGFLYILNAKTGALLQKIGTAVGTAAEPSGLTHITGWTADEGDWSFEQLYAGDLLGNVWRFDVSQQASVATDFPVPTKFAMLTDGVNAQPITTRPVLALATNNTDRYVFIGTGKLLGASDRTVSQTQTFYAFRDGGRYAPFTASTLPAGFTFPLNKAQLAQIADIKVGTSTSGKIGWYVNLGHDTTATSPAERVIVHPSAANGTVTFVTGTPTSASVCTADVKGDFYAVKFESGKSRLVDSVTNAPVAKISNMDGFTKVQLIRVNGKIRAVATDNLGKVTTVSGGALGNELQDGKPHRFYWREILQ